MIITKHANLRYKQNIGINGSENWGKDHTTHRITQHLKQCRPATEIELTYIRKTKKHYYNTHDSNNAKHYIDPTTQMVFVIIPNKTTNENTIITCYHAPYLNFIPESTEHERNHIQDTFKRTSQENSCMRWAVALHHLQEDGFTINNHGIERTLHLQQAKGTLVTQTRPGTTPKIINPGSFHKITWHKKRNWNFQDFNIHSPNDFDEQYK